jgi:hypothetical protein
MRAATLAAILVSSVTSILTAAPPGASWTDVDQILGRPGTDAPGDVRRYGFPRSDLQVRIGDVAVEPPLALGSWLAFHAAPSGDGVVAMGDLVLLGPEVKAVARELQSKGFEILAIHNHLIDETPRVLYLHFHGHGDASSLARILRGALEKTKTPLGAPGAPPSPTAEQQALLQRFQDALGRKGTMAGRVLQIGVPRAETIREKGMDVPPSMGMATAINVQAAGTGVASTGDFVLVADEVNPVIAALHEHGIDVTALHSHMLREEPRLFFMHFWGVGEPERVAAGLKEAIAKTASK